MRNVWSGGSENEPAPYRLYKAYGGCGSLHEMPCKGTFKTKSYCDMCNLRKNICGERPQIKSEDMQSRMSCVVWEGMRIQTMGEYLRVEPNIPRVATGVKNRVEQLKCYGNAVMPQQAYPIFKFITEIERGENE